MHRLQHVSLQDEWVEILTENKYLATNEQDVDFNEWLSQPY